MRHREILNLCLDKAVIRALEPLVDPGDKVQIFEFRPATKDLGSLNNMNGGLFSDKINLDAKNPLP